MKKRWLMFLFSATGLVIVALILWSLARDPVSWGGFRGQRVETNAHLVKYMTWTSVLDKLKIRQQDWLTTVGEPVEAAAATKELLDVGENLIPVLIEQLRQEEDPEKLYRLSWLFYQVSRIDLRGRIIGDLREVLRQLPRIRSQFLEEWDSGLYDRAELSLAQLGGLLEGSPEGWINWGRFEEIGYYGIYALPFLIDRIGQSNSTYAFGLFLGRARAPGYQTYFKEYPTRHVAHQEKIAAIRNWWAENHQNYIQLHPLYEKIDAAVQALPEYPEERAPEN
jgi:hypothetical protein